MTRNISSNAVRLGFVSSCIEAAAKEEGCTYKAMYDRMKRVDLIGKYLIPYYETIHSESRENVTADTLACLREWETKSGVANG